MLVNMTDITWTTNYCVSRTLRFKQATLLISNSLQNFGFFLDILGIIHEVVTYYYITIKRINVFIEINIKRLNYMVKLLWSNTNLWSFSKNCTRCSNHVMIS